MATDYLSALNVGSGLNTTQIIDALVAAEQEPQEALVNSQKDEATVSISSFGTVQQNLTDFGSTLSALDGLTGMSVSQSGTSVDIELTDSSKVSEFSSSIEVSQIAEAHTLVFDGFASEGVSVGSGTLTFEFGTWANGSFTVNSDVTSGDITIDSDADTLAEVKDAINAAGLNVTASILKKSDTNYALVLKSVEGTENALRISSDTGPTDTNLYYLTNYDTSGTLAFNPADGLTVLQTTGGVTNTTAEIQSVTGFSASDISGLSGKTLFFHDGTNTLSVDFSSTPADLDAVVTAITSATGYSNMDFSVSAGTDALTLTYNSADGNVGLADVGYLTTVETVTAADAELSIDGVSVTRTSNIITDLIDGVTLTLNNTTSSAETVSGDWNSDNALLALQVFIEQLNSSISSLKTLTDRGSATTNPGALAGEPLANYLLKQLTSLTTQAIEGFGEESIYLTNFGVLTELDGSLTIDEDTFKTYFDENPTHFAAITTSQVTTDTSLVSGAMLGTDYTAGSYSFAINSVTGAGTIDTDTAMTVSGSTYVATSGDVSGLFLTAETGASSATIYVGRSLSDTLQLFTSEMLASGGDIEDKINTLDENVAEYEEELISITTKMDTIRARYVAQYAAMDAVVAQLKSTETTIENMMESWKAGLR